MEYNYMDNVCVVKILAYFTVLLDVLLEAKLYKRLLNTYITNTVVQSKCPNVLFNSELNSLLTVNPL